MQTTPGYAKGLTDGMPKLIGQEGVGALFRGVVPLWARQIPYTMVKFGEWFSNCACMSSAVSNCDAQVSTGCCSCLSICKPRVQTMFAIDRCLLTHPFLPSLQQNAGAFENTVQALYKYVVPKPKSECSKGEQLGVSFAAGYIAGVLCAAISQPADNLVSKMNSQKGVPVSEEW